MTAVGLWSSVEYWSFVISSEADWYALVVDGFSGDAIDGFRFTGASGNEYHNGRRFSTYDQDTDLYGTGNCATDYGGGWWYNACFHVCLTCSESYHQWGGGGWRNTSVGWRRVVV